MGLKKKIHEVLLEEDVSLSSMGGDDHE